MPVHLMQQHSINDVDTNAIKTWLHLLLAADEAADARMFVEFCLSIALHLYSPTSTVLSAGRMAPANFAAANAAVSIGAPLATDDIE